MTNEELKILIGRASKQQLTNFTDNLNKLNKQKTENNSAKLIADLALALIDSNSQFLYDVLSSVFQNDE